MNNSIILSLIATTGTWFITSLGAATVIFFKNINQKRLNLMLGFAAGVMVSASFWSLLKPAVEQANENLNTPPWLVATTGFLFGCLFMRLCDKAVSSARKKVNKGASTPSESLNRIILLILSITLHNIPEGLAVGVAFGALNETGFTPEAVGGAISVAVGIGLQNFPEGAAVSLPLRREGFSRKKCFLLGQASALVEPVSGVLGALAVVCIKTILPYALSFAAGAMILVAVHELIPQCQQNQKENPYSATAGIVCGFALMTLLDVALS